MSFLTLQIDSDLTNADMTAKLQAADANQAAINLGNFLRSLSGGTGSAAKINLQTGGARASGTATFVSVIATHTLVIAGITFTAVASGATGNQFNVGGSNAITASNATTVINANATLNKFLRATVASNVITITALYPGLIGNALTLAQTGGTITLSGATLTGGTQGTEANYSLGLAL